MFTGDRGCLVAFWMLVKLNFDLVDHQLLRRNLPPVVVQLLLF